MTPFAAPVAASRWARTALPRWMAARSARNARQPSAIGADSLTCEETEAARHESASFENMVEKSVDWLSFTVREVTTREELASVCALRAACYARHAPALREVMAEPDEIDVAPSTTVFACRDKTSGAVIGSMRFVHNTRGGRLEIEDFLEVPPSMAGSRRGELTRLAVLPGFPVAATGKVDRAGVTRAARGILIPVQYPGHEG